MYARLELAAMHVESWVGRAQLPRLWITLALPNVDIGAVLAAEQRCRDAKQSCVAAWAAADEDGVGHSGSLPLL